MPQHPKNLFAEGVLAHFGIAAASDKDAIAKAVEAVKALAPARFDGQIKGRLKFVSPVGNTAVPSAHWKTWFVRQLLEQFGVTGTDEQKVREAVAAARRNVTQDAKRDRKGLRPKLVFIATPDEPA